MNNGLGENSGIEPVTTSGCSQASTGSTRAPNASEGLAPKPQQNRASQSLAASTAMPPKTPTQEEEEEDKMNISKP